MKLRGNILLDYICVRISIIVDGEQKNQGSGFIISDYGVFYVVTADHCIFGENDEFKHISLEEIHIEHQNGNYKSDFKIIKIQEIIANNKQDDWALIRVSDPKIPIDFSSIKLGIPVQKNIEANFSGYQQASPASYRPFKVELLSITTDQFRITLKEKSFSLGSEEGAYIAKGLSGSGVGVEANGTLYLIGHLKSVIGSGALNDDIECCGISCMSAFLQEPIEDLPEIDTKNSSANSLKLLEQKILDLSLKLEGPQSKVEPLSVQRLNTSCRIQLVPGNACIIEFPGNQYGIIDCDRKAAQRVLGYLAFREVNALRFIAISHWHYDHYSGFQEILASIDKTDYAFIPDPNLLSNSKELGEPGKVTATSKMISELEKRHSSEELSLFNVSSCIRRYPFVTNTDNEESVSLTSYAPFVPHDIHRFQRRKILSRIDHNSFSAVYQIKVGELSFLITGDITIEGWNKIFQDADKHGYDIRADGMILPHHGSRSAISKEVLQRLKKNDKIFTLVEPNRKFNLPNKEILKMVEHEGGQIEVFDNTISVLMNADGISVIGEI